MDTNYSRLKKVHDKQTLFKIIDLSQILSFFSKILLILDYTHLGQPSHGVKII